MDTTEAAALAREITNAKTTLNNLISQALENGLLVSVSTIPIQRISRGNQGESLLIQVSVSQPLGGA